MCFFGNMLIVECGMCLFMNVLSLKYIFLRMCYLRMRLFAKVPTWECAYIRFVIFFIVTIWECAYLLRSLLGNVLMGSNLFGNVLS